MKLKPLAIVMTMTLAAFVASVAQAQTSSDLVSALSKELGASTQQAEGAAGSLFNFAKGKLKPEDWTKVAAAVPGMDGLLKAAPATAVGTSGAAGALGAAANAAGGSSAAGLSSLSGAFSKLNLKPEMIAKAVPVLTSFVTKSGGADVGQLLAGALK
ncbi:MAG TPA: DUF2780 domain-containing protein [Vicinamibacterales bacterium]|nr:DUF2780 domain-containing protein [Vicinamibacterales bacterium]